MPRRHADATRGLASGYQCIHIPSYGSLKRIPVCGHIGPTCDKVPRKPLSNGETAAGTFALSATEPSR